MLCNLASRVIKLITHKLGLQQTLKKSLMSKFLWFVQKTKGMMGMEFRATNFEEVCNIKLKHFEVQRKAEFADGQNKVLGRIV